MQLDVSLTFENTYDVFNEMLSDDEYAMRLEKHIKLKLPGVPSKFRYRQIVSLGGSRSSKTYSILQICMLELMTRESIKITVWRNTKVACRANAMVDLKNIMRMSGLTDDFIENKQYASFTNKETKSVIIFEGADDEDKVLGSSQVISFFNEITGFSNAVYLQIRQRTSERIFCDYNPSKKFWLEKQRGDEDSIFIHSTFLDNAFCPPNIVTDLLAYEPWETDSYEIRGSEVYYKGAKISPTNQPPPNIINVKKGTENEFMWLVYGLGLGAEKPNKIYHNWIPISKEKYDSIEEEEYFGLDFGTARPTACISVKFDGNDSFYIMERMYVPLRDINESLVTALKINVPEIKKNISFVVCDSAKDTYIQLLRNAEYMAMKAEKGGGSVESGISTVQSFKIYYVQTDNLENEYSNYEWSLDRYGLATEVPLKRDDHLMDSLKYIIVWLCGYLGIRM